MKRKTVNRNRIIKAVFLSAAVLGSCMMLYLGYPGSKADEMEFVCSEAAATEPSKSLEDSDEIPRADPAEEVTVKDEGSKEPDLSGKIDLNTASEEELMTLKGIGEKRAKAIIAYRTDKGQFSCIEDIMKVSGIKEGIFSKIKEQIRVD